VAQPASAATATGLRPDAVRNNQTNCVSTREAISGRSCITASYGAYCKGDSSSNKIILQLNPQQRHRRRFYTECLSAQPPIARPLTEFIMSLERSPGNLCQCAMSIRNCVTCRPSYIYPHLCSLPENHNQRLYPHTIHSAINLTNSASHSRRIVKLTVASA
jgi:hypothetical protein